MKTYRISAFTRPHFTYNTYPTWWRRLFNKPIIKTVSYFHNITLVVESDVPLNKIKYKDGNVIGPCFEDVSTKPYTTTPGSQVNADVTGDNHAKFSLVEPGGTNLLIDTASTFPNL